MAATDNASTTTTTVFVYGSLLRGLHNSHLLSSATLLLPRARTQSSQFALIDSGHGYPYACHAEALSPAYTRTALVGELIRISPAVLATLDQLEDHPNYYKRELTQVDGWSEPAWVYVLAQQPILDAMRLGTGRDAYREVAPPGDWRAYQDARSTEEEAAEAPEPLLGVGERLPGYWPERLGPPHVHVLSGADGGAHRGGTVIIAHGSAAVNWLGNAGASDPADAEMGGVAQLALRLQQAGLTALVVDSFPGGRRERLGGAAGARERVKDLEAALWLAKERALPTPVHVYGKSNGGWALVQMLHRAQAETLQMVASAIIQCPFLTSDEDARQLAERAAGAAGAGRVPPTLWLLAEEDRMLEQYGEETLVAEAAARSMYRRGAHARDHIETVVGDGGARPCTCAVSLGATAHGASIEVRRYSNIGHTFMMDETHKEITDGSSAPIVEHALGRTVAWCLAAAASPK